MTKSLRNLLSFKGRSGNIKKNVIESLILKGISMLVSLELVPLTLNYVNPTRYGLWLTLSGIIYWMTFFDFGFEHGFRNHFAKAKANDDIKLAKEYVSTTYFIMTILFFSIVLLFLLINNYIDWSGLLNISPNYNLEIRDVMAILSIFMGFNIVAKTFSTLVTADQKPALASLIFTVGQIGALITIAIFVKYTEGSLVNLAFAISGIPCIILIIFSLIYFFSKYREVAPSFKCIKFNLIKNILGLGGKFFGIMLAMLFVVQMINIILTRVLGPESVTIYNIAHKYVGLVNMLTTIIITPIWSAFTEAYTKQDYAWMKSIVHKLEMMVILCIPLMALVILVSPWFYKFWIGTEVEIPLIVTIGMGFFILSQVVGSVYMYTINGIGKVTLQLIIYWVFAIITIPLMVWSCKKFGILPSMIIPGLAYFTQAVFGKIQINKILNRTAIGIWNK